MEKFLIKQILLEQNNEFVAMRYIKRLCFFFRTFVLYAYKKISIIEGSYYDKKFGIETTKQYFSTCDLSDNKDSCPYEAAPYRRLKKIINYLRLSSEDVFIDFGSGKGRVVFFAAMQKIKKAIGVEVNRDLVAIAKNNLNSLKSDSISVSTAIEFINSDVSAFDIKEGNIFFLFNPFGYKTLITIIENIKKSLIISPREIRIVYLNPIHRNLLDRQDWLVLEKELTAKCLIWKALHKC